MNLRWFVSSTVRDASHMHKHVWKLINAQRDILSADALKNVQKPTDDLRDAIKSGADKPTLKSRMEALEAAANKWLKPYPHAGWRENVEVLLVAIAVAMGIRTFIAQPFKIPTGSMQPTLYGVTSTPDRTRGETLDPALTGDVEIPNGLVRKWQFWFRGIGYVHLRAQADGELDPGTQDVPTRFLLFNLKQDFYIGGVKHTVWWPPDKMLHRAGLMSRTSFSGSSVLRQQFKKGDDVIRMKHISGDHLFVDRVTYNFRRPKRGEIIVFKTSGIPHMESNPDYREQIGQFYIKRLVALGGETVQIGADRHLVINGTNRLDRTTPRFERVYSFDPQEEPADSSYSGHVPAGMLLNGKSVEVPPMHLMVLGDNTMSSLDSRMWGSFPQENVIGRSWFVYWPIGSQDGRRSRFGTGNK